GSFGLFHGYSPATRAALWIAAVLTAAVLLGGGGRGYPLFNLWPQLIGLAGLAFCPDAVRRFFARAPRWLVGLAVASVVLPLLQFIPLPSDLWSRRAGHDLCVDVLALVVCQQACRPLSVDPGLTLL